MLLDSKMVKREIEKLNVFSNNKSKYIDGLAETLIAVFWGEEIERTVRVRSALDGIKFILTEPYNDYIMRSKSDKDITEDLEYIGRGHKAIVFRVGDNVIKFRKRKAINMFEINLSKPLVPIYTINCFEINEDSCLIVETSPFVDTNNVTLEDVYQVYKSIRDLGYIWNDPKEENVGRIIKLSGCTIADKSYVSNPEYKEGDLVAIDLEDIAYVGKKISDTTLDEIATMSYNKNVYIFEMRYMNELKQATAKDNKKIKSKYKTLSKAITIRRVR